MIAWLNSNSAAVAAIAAIISAAATLVIAFFSIGTWNLYKLEKGRETSRRQELSARIARAARRLERLTDDTSRLLHLQVGAVVVEEIRKLASPLREQLHELRILYDSAAGLAPEILQSLDQAIASVEYAERSAGQLSIGEAEERDFVAEMINDGLLAMREAFKSAGGDSSLLYPPKG